MKNLIKLAVGLLGVFSVNAEEAEDDAADSMHITTEDWDTTVLQDL